MEGDDASVDRCHGGVGIPGVRLLPPGGSVCALGVGWGSFSKGGCDMSSTPPKEKPVLGELVFRLDFLGHLEESA